MEANEKLGLHGIIHITRENELTGEVQDCGVYHNTVSISGYNWLLLRAFDLYLDSIHKQSYEDIGKDTTVVTPDLNSTGSMSIGVDPTDYTAMNEDFASNHYVQGFMVGNGGAGEDTITSKNTNYSFCKLRNPIPFQQIADGVAPADQGATYLGVYRSSSSTKSYYIKKFSERPHVYHSWWKNGQKWDYLDPVTENDLGPNAVNGAGKTNRIESYIECKLSLSETDCLAYFQHEGSTQTAAINELGLVAFDALYGKGSIINSLYQTKIKLFLNIAFNNERTQEDAEHFVLLANEIYTVMTEEDIASYGETHINNFIDLVGTLLNADPSIIAWESIQDELSDETNIEVEALYNQAGTFKEETDKFTYYMSSEAFQVDDFSVDEAQRIKLFTYFTFNSIPLQENWRLKINYRIYAN